MRKREPGTPSGLPCGQREIQPTCTAKKEWVFDIVVETPLGAASHIAGPGFKSQPHCQFRFPANAAPGRQQVVAPVVGFPAVHRADLREVPVRPAGECLRFVDQPALHGVSPWPFLRSYGKSSFFFFLVNCT